jgi:hypothetical protein
MTDDSKIIELLDKAYKMNLSDETLNYKDEFIVAPQSTAGTSAWATLLKEGKIQPKDVIWAFVPGEKKTWLAVRVTITHLDFKFSDRPLQEVFYFNLRNWEDRQKFKQLEEEFGIFLRR